MKQPHKHAELIKAWADGAEIQYLRENGEWKNCIDDPAWFKNTEYRIKPEQKPDVVTLDSVQIEDYEAYFTVDKPNLKLTWCGETGKLKSAEVI